jgi:NADH-quinone oxidoreductase subunit I
MKSLLEYFKNVFSAFYSLWKGLSLTLYYFFHLRKVNLTEEYPDNRAVIRIPERFVGKIVMPHDENNHHKCTACTLCEMACPNGTIKVISKMVDTEDGKKKKVLDKYVYNLGMCTMCGQCVEACPQKAIETRNDFELSAYSRKDLIHILNQPGSTLKEKE